MTSLVNGLVEITKYLVEHVYIWTIERLLESVDKLINGLVNFMKS